jgi:hypothetical protein
MKKLLVVLGISLVLLAMPLTTTASHPVMSKILTRHHRAMLDGNFSGVYALKNESGYVPLGTFTGTFGGSNYSTTFEGTWAANDGNSSGTMQGAVWSHVFYGQVSVGETNETTWFVGLFDVNDTDNSFRAVSVVFGQEDFTVLYALGNI